MHAAPCSTANHLRRWRGRRSPDDDDSIPSGAARNPLLGDEDPFLADPTFFSVFFLALLLLISSRSSTVEGGGNG
ncbi:unnamed protein product [Cuscuta europaea]|uniref:Uncharacterized protein n=1 Tax=Cuscuta europaea TaxID=41803 RepID=A0A9P0ZCF2_CUSEU|nr:unnamed protein product [Cuscuta europaea]